MKTPVEVWKELRENMRKEWKSAFWTVFLLGLMIHFPVMIGDYPNHDGLASMYFDQNMITSGRWFLSVACSFSSYFALPWVTGLLSLFFLGIAAAALIEFLEIKNEPAVVLISGLLVSFPALASTYAYIFTADGYSLALCLSFLAVLFTRKGERGFIPGGICLAFSMGIYQSYLSFAMLLSVYGVLTVLLGESSIRRKAKNILHYLYMGVLGTGLYYVMLQLLLKVQGKELDTYQGINGMTAGGGLSLAGKLQNIYRDFFAFTGNGKVLYNNTISFTACGILAVMAVVLSVRLMMRRRYFKKWYFYLIFLIVLLSVPVAFNVILLISPGVTYHLLMRYQWCLIPILLLAFLCRFGFLQTELSGQFSPLHRRDPETLKKPSVICNIIMQWAVFVSAAVLVLHYGVTDNIAYSNLQKKYEKTYAYCLRLADRMEQTEGYYTGMPVAMTGVQNRENLPETDITGAVTGNMIGMTGDYLLYTDTNYQAFMKHYLGVTIELVSDGEMERIYRTKEYQELNSFPEEGSMKVVDGILYIKTE